MEEGSLIETSIIEMDHGMRTDFELGYILELNPLDLCFDRKRPYFGWFVVQKRGHSGSRLEYVGIEILLLSQTLQNPLLCNVSSVHTRVPALIGTEIPEQNEMKLVGEIPSLLSCDASCKALDVFGTSASPHILYNLIIGLLNFVSPGGVAENKCCESPGL